MKKYFLILITMGILILSQARNSEAGKKVEPEPQQSKPTPVFIPLDTGNQTVSLPIVEQRDFVGSGLFSNHAAWFSIPKHIEVTADPKLVFSLSHSNILSPTSTLTVWFNDQPIHSMNLSPENAAKGPHEITIPLNLIKPDLNSVEFRFFTISNVMQPCQDLDNPANWVVLHKDSALQVPYKARNLEDLSLFPEPYVHSEKFNQAPLGIVMPKNPTLEERNSAAILIQYLAQQEPFLYSKMFAVLGSTLAPGIEEKTNLISVGALDRNVFQKQLKERLPNDIFGKLDQQKGLVAMIRSPAKPDKVLTLISGANPQTLSKAAQVLTYPALLREMKGFYQIVDTTQPLPGLANPKDLTHPTFKDLGYFTTKLAGTFESMAAFQYEPPPNWEVLPGSSVTLDLNYSPLLNPENSILTVFINDKPVQSFKFTGRDGKAEWTVRIPDDLLDAKTFYVTMKVNLEMKEKDCTNRRYDQAWVIIHDSSFFHIFHQLAEKTGFENFPALFYGDEGLRLLKIVIPDNPTAADYNAAFNIVYVLSSLMPHDVTPHFDIRTVSEMTKDLQSENDLILVGTLERNALSAEANKQMPLPLDFATGKPIQTHIKILPQFLNEVAALELGVSPWNPAKKVLFVSGESESLVELATLHLLNRGTSSQWEGNIVLVNSYDQWYSYGSGEKKRKRISANMPYLSIWIGMVAVIMILLGIILYWRHKHSLQDPFKEP